MTMPKSTRKVADSKEQEIGEHKGNDMEKEQSIVQETMVKSDSQEQDRLVGTATAKERLDLEDINSETKLEQNLPKEDELEIENLSLENQTSTGRGTTSSTESILENDIFYECPTISEPSLELIENTSIPRPGNCEVTTTSSPTQCPAETKQSLEVVRDPSMPSLEDCEVTTTSSPTSPPVCVLNLFLRILLLWPQIRWYYTLIELLVAFIKSLKDAYKALVELGNHLSAGPKGPNPPPR